MHLTGICLTITLLASVLDAHAAQIQMRDYIRLDQGMNEAEVIVRVGQPDNIVELGERSVERVVGRRGVRGGGAVRLQSTYDVREYHYIPDRSEHDPHLTVLTFRGGRLSRLDRSKVLTRTNLPPAPPATEPQRKSITTDEYERRQAEAYLEAAEAYARVRERINQRNAQALERPQPQPPTSEAQIYKSVAPDGSVTFSNRRPVPPTKDQ